MLPSLMRIIAREADDSTVKSHVMTAFLFYCRPGNLGDPVDYLASNQFGKVVPGDELWAVTSQEGGLLLQGRLDVKQVVGREEAKGLIQSSNLWDADLYAIGENPVEPRQQIDITAMTAQLRFLGEVDRLPDEWTPQSLQTIRRLTPESVRLLREAWDGEGTLPSKRNPNWQRDELILALDLYFRLDRRVPDDTDPEVTALSELLNALPIHPHRPDAQRFRNPNGVALKLANFRSLEHPGHGMSRGGQLDQVVWAEFSNKPEELTRLAVAIRAGAATEAANPESAAMEESDESEFPEGRVIYRLHRARERNRKVVAKKKAKALKQHGRLACEVCKFDFGTKYGEVGEGYIECHHTLPLSDLAESQLTRLDDLVLLCSNCHRMVHRKRPWLTTEQVRSLLV